MPIIPFSPDKAAAKRNFIGEASLFEACWKKYSGWLRGAIDNPQSQADVDEWLRQIAAEKVNNPRSKFYIYG